MRKLLFVSINMPDLSSTEGSLYADLLKELVNSNFHITVISPSTNDNFTGLRDEGQFRVLRVRLKPFIGNIPFYKKGIRILSMSRKYIAAYNNYLKDETFDIVMTATPPVSLYDVIKKIKTKSGAKFYLILRDIHPECFNRRVVPEYILDKENIFDECKKPFGINYFVYRLLHMQAQSLYKIADWVGCMSPGNQAYFKSIAPYVNEEKITLLPNWYKDEEYTDIDCSKVKEKYGIKDKFIAIFGGTIGPAQAIWNIAALAKHNLDKKDVVFLVVGRGVKKRVLEDIAQKEGLRNMIFFDYMPREDYEQILKASDLGLISIDEKYSVPTCPSKVIGYMALAKPVLAMFNNGNDYGDFYLGKSKCGLWSVGLDDKKMYDNFNTLYYNKELRINMGLNGYKYYKEHFTSKKICSLILETIGK